MATEFEGGRDSHLNGGFCSFNRFSKVWLAVKPGAHPFFMLFGCMWLIIKLHRISLPPPSAMHLDLGSSGIARAGEGGECGKDHGELDFEQNFHLFPVVIKPPLN